MPKNPTDARSGEDDLTDVTNVTDVNDAADAADDDSPLASDEAALRRARREASLARLAAVRARRGTESRPAAATAIPRREWRTTPPPPPPSYSSYPPPFGGPDEFTGFWRDPSSPFTAPSAMPGTTRGTQKPLTVTEALTRIKSAVAGTLIGVWVTGEVSGMFRSAAGHVYFKLKDATGLVACVAFAGALRKKPADFRDGDAIEVTGRADVYARGGDLQIVVDNWRPAGLGERWEAFLRLKAKLEAEGLFDDARKKRLPGFVRKLAVVTSAQAAAWSDVRRTLARRTPWIRTTLFETPVQGDTAPEGIVRALAAADAGGFDLVLLVRGGGAPEDLDAYNDERVARALAAMRTPTVTGVGHESDVTIVDFVADLRASTPTAAAESVGPDLRHWLTLLARLDATLQDALNRSLRDAMQRTDRAALMLASPETVTGRSERRMREAEDRLRRLFADRTGLLDARLAHAAERLASPDAVLEAKARALGSAAERLRAAGLTVVSQRETALRAVAPVLPAILRQLDLWERRLDDLSQTLKALDPDRPMRDGWTRAERAGEILTRAEGLRRDDELTLRFADGWARVRVEEVGLTPEGNGKDDGVGAGPSDGEA